jgi:hypothetical protein
MIILAYHCGIALHTLITLHGSSTTAPVAKRSGKALAVNSGPARGGSANCGMKRQSCGSVKPIYGDMINI